MPQVVFILSTNYAGSHLLSQLLSAHSACVAVGELHNYRKYREFRTRRDDERNVVDDYETNPMFDGLDALPENARHHHIFENLRARQPAVSTLIDNSKKPAWPRRVGLAGSFDSRFVHLIRDPRALVRRWLSSYATTRVRRRQRIKLARTNPRHLLRACVGSDADVYLYKWLSANRDITRFLEEVDETAPVVTYHDLAVAPHATLQRLMPCWGLDFEPAQLDYGRAAQSGTRKRDYLALAADSGIVFDTRWRNELTAEQRRTIETNREAKQYLARLGIRMTDEGLTLG